ncbi:MAG: hypothetical protein O7D94_12360, partial [Planctomycetota bacterium]|nr:hypothetical protein [Planctomycetota bacterium]
MGRIQEIQRGNQLNTILHWRSVVPATIIAALLGGCTTHPEREVNLEPLALDYAKTEIPDSQLLGVRIAVFDPGELPESKDQSSGLSMEIRKAEARFVAIHLKNVMQRTGHWGPVRVVPSDSPHAEVMVDGRILESDGEILKLDVTVRDAIGAPWFNKEYEGIIDLEFHEKAAKDRIEPFQYLYHQIANDIALYRATMPSVRVVSVRRVAELRFAENFAPRAFKGYLKNAKAPKEDAESGLGAVINFFKQDDARPATEKQHYVVARLPAEDDPLLLRVRRVKARDNMLVDTIDLQYDGLYRRLTDPYRDWRKSRVVEIEAIRKLEDERNAQVGKSVAVVMGTILIEALAAAATGGGSRTPVTAGVAGAVAAIAVQKAVQAVQKASDDAKIHKAGITELGESFAADAQPIVFEVEGETVRLTGTA